jgi:hypothetical protein
MTAPEPAADPFTRAVDGVLAGERLTRRHWQVLHALAFGAGDALDLRDVLAPSAGRSTSRRCWPTCPRAAG